MKNNKILLVFCLLSISLQQPLLPSSHYDVSQDAQSSSDFSRDTPSNSSPNSQQREAKQVSFSVDSFSDVQSPTRLTGSEKEIVDMEVELNGFEGIVVDKQREIDQLLRRIRKLKDRISARKSSPEEIRKRLDKLLFSYSSILEDQ